MGHRQGKWRGGMRLKVVAPRTVIRVLNKFLNRAQDRRERTRARQKSVAIAVPRTAETGAPQVVRVFGKFPALRRMIAALTACVVPMLSAFAILIIFISMCELIPLQRDLRPRARGAGRPASLVKTVNSVSRGPPPCAEEHEAEGAE